MCFEPQLSWIRELAQEEAVRLKREIGKQFAKTGILELPAAAQLKDS